MMEPGTTVVVTTLIVLLLCVVAGAWALHKVVEHIVTMHQASLETVTDSKTADGVINRQRRGPVTVETDGRTANGNGGTFQRGPLGRAGEDYIQSQRAGAEG